MKTPPARRKNKLIKLPFKTGGDESFITEEAARHICPKPQTKPHQHSQWCPDCQFFAKEHPVIKYEEKEVIAWRDFPTFIYWLCFLLMMIVMFCAGAAWQFPFWNRP